MGTHFSLALYPYVGSFSHGGMNIRVGCFDTPAYGWLLSMKRGLNY